MNSKIIDKIPPTGYQSAMRAYSEAMGARKRRRVIGIFLLAAVFFLPLHFHAAAATPQLAKECCCIHGSRTDAGLVIALTTWAPVVVTQWVPVISQTGLIYRPVSCKSSRAPPKF